MFGGQQFQHADEAQGAGSLRHGHLALCNDCLRLLYVTRLFGLSSTSNTSCRSLSDGNSKSVAQCSPHVCQKAWVLPFGHLLSFSIDRVPHLSAFPPSFQAGRLCILITDSGVSWPYFPTMIIFAAGPSPFAHTRLSRLGRRRRKT